MTTSLAIVLLSIAGAVLLALAGWLLIGKRPSAEERERARRTFLGTRGRVTEAEVVDIQGTHIAYSYEVGGVTYQVVQDVAPLQELLPRDPSLLLGPATVKYSPANPANSILMSEEWSGVRVARRMQG